jgi:putative membrane protein
MKKRGWIYLAMFMMLSFAACDDDDEGRNMEDADETFVEQVALGNLTEIQFGTLAATKGTDSRVRAFGEKMKNEHTTAQQELKSIADDYRDVDWPSDMDAAHKQIYQQLQSRQGYSFDSLYMSSQVMDHQQTLTIFDTEVNSGTNQTVKAYATKYRPHIQMHYEEATTIHAAILNPLDGD